ncbi:hypothetical protein AMECASPLE_033508 [Ameca splendens]|uniref:Uncharacterized protein n=1 Tax=Ameca splendens TaxID=208324 RepID=A0ABV0Z607_9TELE
MGVSGHPAEEAHFSCLSPGSRSFGHDPKFMRIGEGRNVHLLAQLSLHHNGVEQHPDYCGSHTALSVNLPLHSPLTHEQDPKIPELLHLRQELPSNPERASHIFPIESHCPGLGGADPWLQAAPEHEVGLG